MSGSYSLHYLLSRPEHASDIYYATDVAGSPCVVKRLKLGQRSEERTIRLAVEGEILEELGGRRHVITLLDRADDPPALVLEFAAAGSLADQLDALEAMERPMPLDVMLLVADQVLDALEHVHAHGVIHRDVKPSNVLFTESGEVRLADFGVAARGHPPRGMPEGWVEERVGTEGYAAPELLADPATSASPALDVYGVAATIYRALTGRTPTPKGVGSDLPWPIAGLLSAALAPKPAMRPTLAEIRHTIRSINPN